MALGRVVVHGAQGHQGLAGHHDPGGDVVGGSHVVQTQLAGHVGGAKQIGSGEVRARDGGAVHRDCNLKKRSVMVNIWNENC